MRYAIARLVIAVGRMVSAAGWRLMPKATQANYLRFDLKFDADGNVLMLSGSPELTDEIKRRIMTRMGPVANIHNEIGFGK